MGTADISERVRHFRFWRN